MAASSRRAHALLGLGRSVARRGELRALTPLNAARDIFLRLDATRCIREIDDWLDGFGETSVSPA